MKPPCPACCVIELAMVALAAASGGAPQEHSPALSFVPLPPWDGGADAGCTIETSGSVIQCATAYRISGDPSACPGFDDAGAGSTARCQAACQSGLVCILVGSVRRNERGGLSIRLCVARTLNPGARSRVRIPGCRWLFGHAYQGRPLCHAELLQRDARRHRMRTPRAGVTNPVFANPLTGSESPRDGLKRLAASATCLEHARDRTVR